MDFEFGDVFYAVVSDRNSHQEQIHLDPEYRIHRGLVLLVQRNSIIEGDERFLRDQVALSAGLIEYDKSRCFHTIEDAQQFIDEQTVAEETVSAIL